MCSRSHLLNSVCNRCALQVHRPKPIGLERCWEHPGGGSNAGCVRRRRACVSEWLLFTLIGDGQSCVVRQLRASSRSSSRANCALDATASRNSLANAFDVVDSYDIISEQVRVRYNGVRWRVRGVVACRSRAIARMAHRCCHAVPYLGGTSTDY